MNPIHHTREFQRVSFAKENNPWKNWGPFLTDRQWGTVREDYSPDGAAWESVTHDMARSKTYRWGEEGIGGISDNKSLLCFAPAFWNGKDRIIKERYFGLSGNEGNHGEDVKELYYYLDSTPSHSYMKMLYKYPQNEFPYDFLTAENNRRTRADAEFEIADTGIFDNNEYFDIYIEYAKADRNDILIKISVANRSEKAAEITVLPTIWFRNLWSWGYDGVEKPRMSKENDSTIKMKHCDMPTYRLYAEGGEELIFCENQSNNKRLYGTENESPYCKDGIHEYIVNGITEMINPACEGTKAAVHYQLTIEGKQTAVIKLRLSDKELHAPFENFEPVFFERVQEADEFYNVVQDGVQDSELRMIQRQAYAGMMWSKQFYYFNINKWLNGDPIHKDLPKSRLKGRNNNWKHLNNSNVISMPDKWEYPWYAAWDLAFHCIPIARIDPFFAKRQLTIMLREYYMHPNGQIPAYEWQFGDVNPPVHAWACWRVYEIDRDLNNGKGDIQFLERVFHKLMLNFTWWVNQKDAKGNNIFEGGFLGLDNIGVFDRSQPLPIGGRTEQADGTSWMAMYALNMLRIASELSLTNNVYEDSASKFFEHFLYIAGAMTDIGGDGIGLWDEEEQFFFDVIHLPDGHSEHMKVRSIVGLIPLFAVEILDHDIVDRLPSFKRRLEWIIDNRPDLALLISRWHDEGKDHSRLLSLLRGHRMTMVLKRMLDESEFLSDHGIRALSKAHKDKPYEFHYHGRVFAVSYKPGESDSGMFGGNSNWRGPIWFPINYMIIESLLKYDHYYGGTFQIEYPTGSGVQMSLKEVAAELSKRLTSLFTLNAEGKRPFHGDVDKFSTDPFFKDNILFYEYFHGDNGRGCGASHQTGWTGLIADLIQTFKEYK